MKQRTSPSPIRESERGASLIIIAAALIMILAAAAIAIDLGGLYLERTEAQRAADAGALAGAQVFATSGCTVDGSCLSSGIKTLASTQATAVAQQNLVFSQTPTIPAPAFASGGGSSGDPLITVVAQAPARTFFIPLPSGATVGATATAEAYNPSSSTPGTGPTICASCLKPFFLPNCDPTHLTPANANCPTTSGAFFNNGSIANPGASPSGIVGESWQLHFQGASGKTVPSQWLEIDFSATAPGCSGGQGATAWSQAVTQCSTNELTCGSQLCSLNGGKQGPNHDAVCELITYTSKCTGNNTVDSVDSISCSKGTCTVTAGSGNPFASSGQVITQSSSLVSVPVYDGTLVPGGGPVTIVGYMQVFISDVTKTKGGDEVVDATIVSATTCGNTGGTCSTTGGGSGTSGTASGGGASLIPVRLVHQ